MNEAAFYLLSHWSGTPFTDHMTTKQQEVNNRWRTLCQQLGVTYKKAEETKYGLKLLELQLKQLNAWMAQVESKLRDYSITDTCEVAEVQQRYKVIKVWFTQLIDTKLINSHGPV